MSNNIEIINVGNGTKEYPGNFTKKEKEIINNAIIGFSLHLFSGKSNIGDVRVDFEYGNVKMDVFEYLTTYDINSAEFQTIILDAPYNAKFALKYDNLNPNEDNEQFIIYAQSKKTTTLWNLIREHNPKRIIQKSWNHYVPKGYHLNHSYVCYAGGFRRQTFLEIYDRDEEGAEW